MPTPATDRHRIALAVVAVVSVGLAALSFRILNAAAATARKPIPANDLQSLSAYLAPLPDSGSLAAGAFGSMVGEPDPFGAPAPVGRAAVTAPVETVSRKPPRPQRVVSSILFEDSRRSAIVNDSWVSVGDALGGGARVAAIERKYVVVMDAKGMRLNVPLQDGRHED
jgi:hypothetical protein